MKNTVYTKRNVYSSVSSPSHLFLLYFTHSYKLFGHTHILQIITYYSTSLSILLLFTVPLLTSYSHALANSHTVTHIPTSLLTPYLLTLFIHI